MADLHDFQLRLTHGWGQQEVQRFHAPKMLHAYTPKKATFPLFKPAEDIKSEPSIPDPAVFRSLTQSPSGDSPTALPSVSEVATHLELLEAIYHLRTDVVSTKRLDIPLGMPPASTKLWKKKIVRGRWYHVQMPILDKDYEERSKEKWVLFLKLAVHRFEIWAGKSEALMKEAGEIDPAIPYLPPLDVLAVWHSFLLNPGDYMRYCKRRELKYLPLARFPWQRIHESIRSKAVKVAFEPPSADAAWFAEATQQPVSLFAAIWGAAETPGGPVAEAILDFTDQERKADSSVDTVLSKMSETDENHGFVRLLSAAKNAAEENVEPMVNNVIRQGAFVDKMHSHLWMRSPAMEDTLQGSIDRYDKLTQLFRDYPNRTFVPTLDMDLAWHTHQLSHARYRNGIRAITGRFIDHDDKIGQGTLDTKEVETRRLFQDVFDEEYARCMCWNCEAIFSAVEADDEMSADPEYLEDLASKVRGDVQYYRAAEVTRRKAWPRMYKRAGALPTPERVPHEPYIAPGSRVWVPMQF